MELLSIDLQGAMHRFQGVQEEQLESLYPQLEEIRRQILTHEAAMLEGLRPIPPHLDPLENRFITLPEQTLADYQADRRGSDLARVFRLANSIHARFDRMVISLPTTIRLAVEAFVQACCQPNYQDLARPDRGGRPRLFFLDKPGDNDATRGLLHLLGAHSGKYFWEESDRWGIVAYHNDQPLDPRSDARDYGMAQLLQTLATQLAHTDPTLPNELREACLVSIGDETRLRSRWQKIAAPDLKLDDHQFEMPEPLSARFSPFTTAGLLPAALVGINIVQLLEGAEKITEHFRSTPVRENIVLRLAATLHLLEHRRDCSQRIVCGWNQAMAGVGAWYEALYSQSLCKDGYGGTARYYNAPDPLLEYSSELIEGKRNKVFLQIRSKSWRFDPIRSLVKPELTTPDLASVMTDKLRSRLMEQGRPSICIEMKSVEEPMVGQLMQLLMLVTLLEGRLTGINPYGEAIFPL